MARPKIPVPIEVGTTHRHCGNAWPKYPIIAPSIPPKGDIMTAFSHTHLVITKGKKDSLFGIPRWNEGSWISIFLRNLDP
jgi:hypothetical protein